jgi:hypothetical protein
MTRSRKVSPPAPGALNRRACIGRTLKHAAAAAVAAPCVSRGKVLGANDRLGVGGRGRGHVASVQKRDATSAHWRNSLGCVRSRQQPVSDVEFGQHVQAALNMAMRSLLKDKVVKFDFTWGEIVA